MKRFLLSAFLLIFMLIGSIAQEKANNNIELSNEKVGNELIFNTHFNEPLQAGYSIFKHGVKQKSDFRLDNQLQIPSGNETLSIDISSLPKGEYFIELYTNEAGRIFRKIFIKE